MEICIKHTKCHDKFLKILYFITTDDDENAYFKSINAMETYSNLL